MRNIFSSSGNTKLYFEGFILIYILLVGNICSFRHSLELPWNRTVHIQHGAATVTGHPVASFLGWEYYNADVWVALIVKVGTAAMDQTEDIWTHLSTGGNGFSYPLKYHF